MAAEINGDGCLEIVAVEYPFPVGSYAQQTAYSKCSKTFLVSFSRSERFQDREVFKIGNTAWGRL